MKVFLLRKLLYYCLFAAMLFTTSIVKAQCPTVPNSFLSFCDLESPTVSSLIATNNGGGVSWYLSPVSTTPLAPTVGLINNQTYYADTNPPSCGTRPSINVKVYSAPTGLSFQGDCYDNPGQATVAMLDAVGNNVRWYLVSSGGVPLNPATILIDNTIYYASQTNPDTGCETSRLSVFVNNGIVPVPTGNPIQEFCVSPGNVPTVGNLTASGNNNWYLTETSAVPLLFTAPLINGQSYFATTNDPPCESIDRFEVVAILVEPHDSGINGTVEICQNNVGSILSLFSELGGTPENTGTWTGPLSTTNGHLGNLNTSSLTVAGSPYVFTYTVSSSTCGPSTSTITINVVSLPAVTASGNTTICSGQSATVTFNGTPNGQVIYTVNGGAQQSINLDASGTATIIDNYSFTTVYTVISVNSNDANACVSTQTATITITVLPLPVANISADQTICSGNSATVTFTGTPNSIVTYTINGISQTILLDSAGVGTVTGNYTTTTTFLLQSISTSGTPSCSQPQSNSMIINVIPVAVASISTNTQICPGEIASVTFTGTPNASVLYTVNAGNLQNIALNASGTATITQVYNATTIYTLVGVIAPGSTICPSPASGTITITVLPLSSVVISGATTICEGDLATVTFTGTPGATISYTTNGGAIQTIILDATGIATFTSTYTSTTIINLVSATSPSTPACTISQSGTITITVVALPIVSLSTNISICEGETAVVTFTGTPNAIVTYTINGGANQTIILDAAGSATITNTYTVTTVFTLISAVTAEGSNCMQPQNDTMTVTVIPAPIVTISGNTSICPGDTATVTFTGTPNATVSFTMNGGTVQTIVLNGNGIAELTTSYTITTTYEIVGISTSGPVTCPVTASGLITITVVPLPVVTISGASTICEGEEAIVTFTGTPNATITYTINGGTNQTIILDGAGSATIVGNYSVNTTFTIISASSTGIPACSQPQTGSIQITVIPSPTASVSVQTPICVGENSTITFTGTPNTILTYTIDGGANQTILLGASGTASTTNSYSVNTTITLVSVSLSGSFACVTSLSQSVTINVTQLPVVAITGTTAICAGESATITFTGTPGATVTYTINGVTATVALDSTGIGIVTNTYNQNTTFTLIDITGAENPNCDAPASGTAIITIVPAPTVSISGTTTICTGNTASVTFTGTPGAVITFTVNGVLSTLVLDASGTAIITGIFTSNTVFVLQSAALPGSSTCSQPQSGTAVVTVLSQPTASISASSSVCLGSQATVTFNGTPGATIIYTINGGANQSIVLNSSGIATITQIFTTTTIFNLLSVTLVGQSGCTQQQAGSMIVTVIQPPVASIFLETNDTICSGQTSVITITGTPNSTVSYTVNGGVIQTVLLNNSGVATLTPSVSSTSIFSLVSATTGGSPACTATQTGSVTITTTPVPNAGNDVFNQIFCSNAGLQDLFLLLGSDADLGGVWSPVLSGGDGIFDPEVDTAGTYTYTVSGTAPCVDDIASITISIQTPPNAGSNATLSLCSNQDPIDLFPLLGSGVETNGTWSPVLSSGTSIFNPAVDSAGIYTYTIDGPDPCGDSSAAISITITPGPEAGQNGELILCIDSNNQNLFDYLQGSPVTGGIWSPALASGTGIFNPAIDSGGVYTYTFSGPQICDNDTATVTVIVNPIPDAGDNGIAFFCTNYAPADLFLNLMGTPQLGGTWTPALASGTGVFNPLLDAAGIYTYSVGGGLCSIDSANVEVTVTQSPNAGGIGATLLITTCLNITSIDLTTALNGTQDAGTWNDDDSTGALNNNIFNPSLVGAGTYHFTYTVGGGVSPCLFDSATVTVIVDPQPNAGTFTSPATVCSSVGIFDLFTLLNNNQPGGVWTNNTGQIISSSLDISAFLAGTYNFTYTITNACGTDAEIVALNVLQSPVFTNANISMASAVCVGGSAIVTFTGLPNGSYTINYSLSGSNVLAMQTVLLNVTAGVGTLLIPATLLPSTGSTIITFNSILNNVTNCSATLSNVQLPFVVNPISNLSGVTYLIPNVCLGSPVVVNMINSTGLPDGTYTFGYTVAGANPTTATTAPVVVVNGAGQFTIPGTIFPTAGTYNGTITNINSQNGCSNSSVSGNFPIVIQPVPNVAGALVATADICIGADSTISVSGAVSLADGTYTITYQLSGAVTLTDTKVVTFVSGSTTFIIPENQLNAAGNVTLTITQLIATGGVCGAGSTGFNQVIFNVSSADVPTLITLGNEFCSLDSPTIADLSANINGGAPVIWYNAPQNGTAYSSIDLLQNGLTYYASFVDTTCENSIRLAVTVDLTKCPDILIPDGFSPNDDGINDFFVIRNLPELYPNYKIEIYNRYGNILYKGDRNTQNWDGTSSQGGVKIGGNVVPTGVYFFILEFNDGTRNPIQGRLYLSR